MGKCCKCFVDDFTTLVETPSFDYHGTLYSFKLSNPKPSDINEVKNVTLDIEIVIMCTTQHFTL